MTTIRRIQRWRHVAEAIQAVVIIGLPFIKIGGESALRFDVPTLRLHFFGVDLWMEEFFLVLVALIFLSLLVILITLLFGRVWCGWMCPQTVITDFTSFVDRTSRKGWGYTFTAWGAVFLVSVVVAANLIWYFVSPYEFMHGLFKGGLGHIVWGFWIVLTAIVFLNLLLLRKRFCATVCPYAKMQSTLFDNSTLTVAYDPRRKEECMDCMACVRTCPVGIDIRKGQNIACIHCAECVDRCAAVMAPGQKSSLIGYFFGLPGQGGKIFRQNAVMIGLITAAFLAFFIYLLSVRVPLDMTVLPNYAFQPRIINGGSVVNSYILSVKNRGREDAYVMVKVNGFDGSARVVPDKVLHVQAGRIKKLPVYISLDPLKGKELMQTIDIVIASVKDDNVIKRKANFIIPEDK